MGCILGKITKDHLRKSRFGTCPDCREARTDDDWCHYCESRKFELNFPNWSSGNDEVDKLIRETQLRATGWDDYLEWIPYEHLRSVQFYAKGGYGIIYKACLWEYTINDEPPPNWWRWRFCSNRWCVGLLDNNAPDVEFLSQMRPRLRCVDYDDEISVFGVTQHPISGKYLLVIEPTFLLLRRYLYAPAQPKNSSKFCPLSL